MKKLVVLAMLLVITHSCSAQHNASAEQAYIEVIKDGPSTAPDYVVVTINNLQTKESKEICTTVTDFFDAIEYEYPEKDYKIFKEYLLSKSSSRIFDIKNLEALKRIRFDKYVIKNEKIIDSIIIKEHLVDSLRKEVKYNSFLHQELEDYYEKRTAILKILADSIKTKRALNEEEIKMIGNLPDRYYDNYYTDTSYNKYSHITSAGKDFMKTWNQKIKTKKEKLLIIETEHDRMYNKFFQKYYDLYDLNFCHVAFRYGIITFIGDEYAAVGFSHIVPRDN